ncbi:MAG: hypothetical protein RIM84_03580 [Alphaproteobacteria bacterium]
MYASDPMTTAMTTAHQPARPVSTRAALGIWAVASVGGWLAVAGLLRVFGAF